MVLLIRLLRIVRNRATTIKHKPAPLPTFSPSRTLLLEPKADRPDQYRDHNSVTGISEALVELFIQTTVHLLQPTTRRLIRDCSKHASTLIRNDGTE